MPYRDMDFASGRIGCFVARKYIIQWLCYHYDYDNCYYYCGCLLFCHLDTWTVNLLLISTWILQLVASQNVVFWLCSNIKYLRAHWDSIGAMGQ